MTNESSRETTVPLVDVIAALHHPVRHTLIELLGLDGPATVSALAEASHERIGNVSHHIKVLADAGIVEEAPELAKDRRERWWRYVPQNLSWSSADVAGDPVGELVASAAEQQNLAHQVTKVQEWFSRRGEYDEAWVRAAFSTNSWISVTATELDELSRRMIELIAEYGDIPAREQEDASRQRVFVFAHGVPARP
jgi:DNA-binding transcriptional ArsR family regulator